MNAWSSVWNGPAVQAWGAALLHFLWQGAILGILAWAALRGVDEARPRLRYAIACLFLVLMALAPVATLAILWPAPAAPLVFSAAIPPDPPPSAGAPFSAPAASVPWSLWASGFWLAGAAFFTLRVVGGWGLAWHESRRMRLRPPDAWLEAAARLSRSLALPRTVRLFVSERLSAPQVFGYLRPVVLLPAAALSGLSLAQVEAILAHELAHVARHDVLINYLQAALEALLFYHPAVWWLSRRIREEREACCDERAAEWCGDRAVYGRALLAFEEMRAGFALAATGSPLARRVHRLLAPQSAGQPFWLAALLCITLAAGVASSLEQPQPPKPAPVAAQPAPAAKPAPAAPAARQAAKPAAAPASELARLEREIRELEAQRLETLRRKVEIDAKRFDLGVITSFELMRTQLAAARAAHDAAQVRKISENMLQRARREIELGALSPLEFEEMEATATEAMLSSALEERRSELQRRQGRAELAARAGEIRVRVADPARQRAAEARAAERLDEVRRVQAFERQRTAEARAAERLDEVRRVLAIEAAARAREQRSPYRRWLEEDVVYIIAPEEKSAFERLKTDEEREKFIEQFWQRRDPSPATAANEFKEELYRRIAYTNERFRAAETAGWRTGRGRIYILNGPPDEIETHPPTHENWRYRDGRIFEFTLPAGALKRK